MLRSLKKQISLLINDQYKCMEDVKQFYRLNANNHFEQKKRSRIKKRLEKKYFIILGGNSKAGVNLNFPHPRNIVIGANVIIGDNCTIYHDVTFGQSRGLFPCIGNNVIVYTGAKVVGGVSVGDNAIIGANSVVTHDIPPNAIVGGMPAKIIKMRTSKDEFY